MMKRVNWIILAGVAFVLLIQLVPYGRNHTNPPVRQEPVWDSPETRAMAQTACFDCHSNETVWPWYSNVAPVSWLVQRDVDHGREHLNFSEWGLADRDEDAEDLAEVVLDGEMPMPIYLVLHGEARLTDAEKEQLARGLALTADQSPGGEHEEDEGDEDDDHHD